MMEKGLERFFWDVDPSSLDLQQNKTYIIERLLELGDEKAIRWLFMKYPRAEIVEVIGSSRSISPKSRSYWRLILEEARNA
jgi:hypothetical protein